MNTNSKNFKVFVATAIVLLGFGMFHYSLQFFSPPLGKLTIEAHHGDKEALAQLEHLAKSGDPNAEYALGSLYIDVFTTEAAYNEHCNDAIVWLRKAAEQGHTVAQGELSNSFHRGCPQEELSIGKAANAYESYYWRLIQEKTQKEFPELVMQFRTASGGSGCHFSIVGPNGEDLGQKQMHAEYEKQLTTGQVTEIKKRVMEWKPTSTQSP